MEYKTKVLVIWVTKELNGNDNHREDDDPAESEARIINLQQAAFF